ncbi:MAG: recombinase RecA, partial [Spirochaetaceae bacterium]|nr:recombinase RecA [Spirochaetaceae bacterium]
KVKVVKNKVAPPFRKVELDLYFGKGISATASILDSAVKHGLVDKKGAWYAYGEDKIGQGKENAVQYFEDHQDFTMELENKIRAQIFPGQILRTKEGNPISDAERSAILAEMQSRGVGGKKEMVAGTEQKTDVGSEVQSSGEGSSVSAADLAAAAGEIASEEAPF